VIAVTNQPESALVAASDIVLPLHAGRETSGVSSRKRSSPTTVVLTLLCDRLCGRAPDSRGGPAGCRRVSTLCSKAGDAWLATVADLLDGADSIGVLAPAGQRGWPSRPRAVAGGPRLRASAHEAVDWLHTAIYTALPGYRA
jgi:fructoselysine-6-P-deglycase FrlB-like protein